MSTSPRPRSTASRGSPSRRRRGRSGSSGGCGARPPRAGSTRRSPGASFPRTKRRRSAAANGGSQNPISEEMKVMRPSLLPSLIAAARRNFDRGQASVRLFEIGRRYLADAEHPTVALILAGDQQPRDWQAGKAQDFDAFDAKAEALALARGGGRADRQPAAVPRCRPDLASRAARRPCGWGRRRCSRRSASFTRAWCRASMRRPVRSRRKSISTRSRRARDAAARAPAFAPPALQPVTRDFAFLVPRRPYRRHAGPRDPRRRQGGDHRGAAVRPLREQGRPVSWRSKSRSSPATKASPTRRSAAISKRIVAAAEKLGAQLRS